MVKKYFSKLVKTPTGGSSEEYWSMGAGLNQPSSVKDDCPMAVSYTHLVSSIPNFPITARISMMSSKIFTILFRNDWILDVYKRQVVDRFLRAVPFYCFLR